MVRSKAVLYLPTKHTRINWNLNMGQPTCEKKLKLVESKMQRIMSKIELLKLNDSHKSQLEMPILSNKVSRTSKVNLIFAFGTAVFLVFGARWIYRQWPSSQNCIFKVPSSATALFRPPEDCSMCAGVSTVTRLANTSALEFEQFAYSAEPVIVTDATANWRAVQDFNFNFFASFYQSGKMGKQINNCFFFPYKSGLRSLEEVFSMDEARANLSGAPWYVGWSTCYDEETRKLRQFYNRPYFLPESAESDMVDWLFMGGPGQGAHMHVDSVKHMSWQAQIRGHKRWELAPPPECLYYCQWISFTVHSGEILVVDTNRWYHKTTVLPGDISITIGAEYD